MLSTFIICIAAAIISILLLILIKINILDLYGALGSVSNLLPGLIRVIFFMVFFGSMVIAIANLREYYVSGLTGWYDIILVLVITLLMSFFMFDFPWGIADTLSSLGGCSLLTMYFYLVQD